MLKYTDLVEQCRAKGLKTWCFPIEIGCRGYPGNSSWRALKMPGIVGKDRQTLLKNAWDNVDLATTAQMFTRRNTAWNRVNNKSQWGRLKRRWWPPPPPQSGVHDDSGGWPERRWIPPPESGSHHKPGEWPERRWRPPPESGAKKKPSGWSERRWKPPPQSGAQNKSWQNETRRKYGRKAWKETGYPFGEYNFF